MRRSRADHNQPEIVDALRRMGVSVAVTSAVGNGFSDLVCGYRGRNELIEVKNGPLGFKYTDAQKRFHAEWRGRIVTFQSLDEAVEYFSKEPK